MSDLRKAAQRALEAWDRSRQWPFPTRPEREFDVLRAAIAQPERKPLTDEQIDAIVRSNVTITDQNLSGAVYMAMRELEAAHGIEGDV